MQVVTFDGMLQGNTVENTCEMSNSIGFLVGKNFRSLKYFMTMKFTNIALQTFIEIKNYCVRSTAFFASSRSVSVYTVDRKINGLVFKSLSEYNQFQYIYIGIKKTFVVLTVTSVKSVGPITSDARVELKPGLGLDLKTGNPATPSNQVFLNLQDTRLIGKKMFSRYRYNWRIRIDVT